MVFSLLILLVLWVLQFAFLNNFYESMKKNEITKIGDQIVLKYGTSDFDETIIQYAFKHNLRIITLDGEGNILKSSDGFNIQGPSNHGNVLPMDEFQNIINKFKNETGKTIQYINKDVRSEMSQIAYVARLGSGDEMKYLYISSPMPPLDPTLNVLKSQFIIISIIIFLLSLITAQIISRKMSKPIINLTKSAEKLAQGDLDVDFSGEGYTEVRKLAKTLSYATDELSKIDNYRKEFIANVSHDLKTPLTIIKVYGEMIRDVSGDKPEKRNEHCKMIIKEADLLSEMVNEILELSKIESKNVEIKKEEFNFSKCVLETLGSFDILSEKEGYIFETDVEDNLMIQGNEPYLRRVIYNLISNAINYTGDDKLIKISLKKLEGKVRFEVTDTGVGISEEEISSIWDRYYKDNEVHKRAVVGTGLGLAIVKNVLIMHNTEFGIISQKDQGSTFWFEI